MTLRQLLCALLLVVSGGAVINQPTRAAEESPINPANADPMDWPHWRGPEQNGISRETGLIESWNPRGKGGKGENVLWKREDLAGRSTPIVMRGRMYTIVRDKPGTPEEGERIVCVNAATGDTVWERRWNVFLSDVPDTRIGWSSAVGDPTTGNVYAQGVNGFFQCFNGETGETLWSHSMSEEYGMLSTYGGRTNFPVIYGNLVFVSGVIIGWGEMAQPAHRFVAFDKRNGQAVWFNGTAVRPEDTTYSTPVTTVVNGQPQLIFGSSDGGVHAMQPLTGKIIWSYIISPRGINTAPIVVDGKVYCGHGEENLDDRSFGAIFALDASKSGDLTKGGEIWKRKLFAVGKSCPIMVGDKLVCVEDSGNMLVIDSTNGKEIARKKLGTMMTGSPVYADGKIYVCAANGRFHILKLNGESIEKVHELRLNNEEVHASPVISQGRIYLQTMNQLYCLGKADAKPAAEDRPAPPAAPPAQPGDQPVQVQLVPVESLLKPGQKQQFQARLYNEKGQYLKTLSPGEVKFSIAGPGSIDGEGRYASPEDQKSAAAIAVTAEWTGDKNAKTPLKSTARIRLVPPLPWKYDFDDGDIPITWVGIRYRHIPLDFDLFKSLEARDPLAAQLYIYLTTSFVNSGRPAVKYDNSTPAQMWTEFLRFVRLLDSVTNVEQAKGKLDKSLQLLVDEKVINKFTWSDQPGVALAVERGPRKVEGNGVMCKVTTIPKGTRSQGWMGHTDFHDYSIQADVYATTKDGKLPDMGLIAQRYTLDLMGSSQQLQVRQWPPVLTRMSKNLPYKWTANKWYTIKLSASVEGKKAVLRGKVWVRGETEPADWQLVAEDIAPNTIGSPGLFANATNAELFYDNIQVEENPKTVVGSRN